jgi:hypothetical protein
MLGLVSTDTSSLTLWSDISFLVMEPKLELETVVGLLGILSGIELQEGVKVYFTVPESLFGSL